MTTDETTPGEWEPARYSLNGYAREHLILSWRKVPGRGLVVIGADMAETELRTARDAEMFMAGLASAECAVHDGEAKAPSPHVVCLCGSTRFREAFERAGREETLRGAIVLTVNDFDAYGGPQRGQQDLAVAERAAADALHRSKIDMAGEVLVVSEGGYFGDHVAGEIAYAAGRGKPVRFAEPSAEKRAREMGLVP